MGGMVNHYRERTVALLAMRYDPVAPERLADFAAPAESAALAGRIAQLAALPPAELVSRCGEQLEGLRMAEEVVLLSEIHPAWLVEVLEQESPRVVGLLLRYLPSRHVRYVMEHLPASLKDRLPNVIDAFAVSSEILRLVRRRFEAHFAPIRPARQLEQVTFQDLWVLRAEEFETLLHDLGIQELAFAFRDMDRRAIHMVLNRLQFRDAKALKERIEGLTVGDGLIERDAKYSIFDMAIDEGDAATILKEIGIHSLAKAFVPTDRAMVDVIRLKLAPRFGYLLRRCTDLYGPRTHPGIVAGRQTLVLQRLAQLSATAAIDPQLQSLLPQELVRAAGVESTATKRVVDGPNNIGVVR